MDDQGRQDVFKHAWVETAVCDDPCDRGLPLRPLQNLLDEAVDRWPARPAIEFMGKLISYRELGALVDQSATGLQQLGVGPGVRVALHLPITPHVAIAFFAVLKAGGTLVDCSGLKGEPALCRALDASRCEMLITLAAPGWYEPIRRPLHTTRLKTVVVGTLAQFAAQPDALIAAQHRNGEHVDVPVDGRHVRFGHLLRNDGRHRVHSLGRLDEAVALLRCVGSDSEVLTHAALSTVCRQRVDATRRAEAVLCGGDADTRVALPLTNARTLIADMLLCVQLGALQLLAAATTN
jgi:long-chain acyl-CoA synthetase